MFLRKQENVSPGTSSGHPLLWGQPKTNVDISSTKMIEWVCSFVYICFACIQGFGVRGIIKEEVMISKGVGESLDDLGCGDRRMVTQNT